MDSLDQDPANDTDNKKDGHTPHSPSTTTQQQDFFAHSAWLSNNITPSTPLPLCTFHTETTVFQLNHLPSLKEVTVDEIATKFKIPDLRPALTDYICCVCTLNSTIFKFGQRQTSSPDADLPFTHLNVWYSVRIQTQTTDAIDITTPQRVCTSPSSAEWPFGRHNTVLLSDGTPLGPSLGGAEHLTFIWYLLTLLQASISHKSA